MLPQRCGAGACFMRDYAEAREIYDHRSYADKCIQIEKAQGEGSEGSIWHFCDHLTQSGRAPVINTELALQRTYTTAHVYIHMYAKHWARRKIALQP